MCNRLIQKMFTTIIMIIVIKYYDYFVFVNIAVTALFSQGTVRVCSYNKAIINRINNSMRKIWQVNVFNIYLFDVEFYVLHY